MTKDPMDVVASVARRDPDFFRAFRLATSSDPLVAGRAVVELAVLTARSGDAWTPQYLAAPAHLPDAEVDMRALLASQVKADADLRRDLVEWADVNRLRQDRAAKALENLVFAYRHAEAVLSDPDSTDEELMEWRDELVDFAVRHFGADLVTAPTAKDDVEAWTWAAAGQTQPTPPWLFRNEEPRGAFQPGARKRRTGPRTVGAAIAAHTEQGED